MINEDAAVAVTFNICAIAPSKRSHAQHRATSINLQREKFKCRLKQHRHQTRANIEQRNAAAVVVVVAVAAADVVVVTAAVVIFVCAKRLHGLLPSSQQ